ncbi:MAG: hypothetical protein AAGI23_18155 [Bacteroidota bacterium]
MKQQGYLKRRYIRLKERVERTGFQQLSLKKQNRLKQRLRACRRVLFGIGVLSGFAAEEVRGRFIVSR